MKNKIVVIRIISTFIILIIIGVLLEAVLTLFNEPTAVWIHIKEKLLFDYTINTIMLVSLSMLFSGMIGTVMAYFITCFDFYGRKVLSVLLYFPLAIPPYIGAYVYMDMFQKGGLSANIFRTTIPIQSLWMSVFVFTLFLFPYVYIGVRGYLSNNMAGYIENARLLRKSEVEIFLKVILPISKYAIFSGMIFVGLEVLGDFGVVQYLGVQTFATAIFKSWINFKDFDSAIRLSGSLVLVILFLLVVKYKLLVKKQPSATTTKTRALQRRKVSKLSQAATAVAGFSVLLLSFALPIYQLILWTLMSYSRVRYNNVFSMLRNTLFVSIGISLLIVVLAVILSSYTRVSSKSIKLIYGKLSVLPYAIPGSVIAMMLIVFFLKLDDFLKLSLGTTLFILLTAYVIRYLGIAYENLDNGYKKIGLKYHEASRTLGESYYRTLLKVDIPMLKPFIFSAFSLVFLDLIKELPLTLILRPFNFGTLSTQVYQYASDEMLEESAVPSIIIIALSMIFIYGLIRKKRSK
jgi:iron(III) transport system permease protein